MNINDNIFLRIINPIITHKKFKVLKKIEHHGVNRFEHCLKVSYYSYKIAKFFKLDYFKTARAGLLHDFFFNNKNILLKENLNCLINHPKVAVQHSLKYFNISKKEINIIESHMFPLGTSLPKYTESWIVSIVDKVVALKEHTSKYTFKLSYATNLFILFLVNALE